jgi:hypothetical protein
MTNNLARLWQDNEVQYAAFQSIWRTAYHAPSAWGEGFLRGRPQEFVANCVADVYGEYIMVWSIMMLLTASRPIVDYRHVDPVRLNKARRRRDEVPLYSHTQVTLHLDKHSGRLLPRAPLGYTRKSPRVHLVSSYLARRGDKHWIVQPYWRGQGETISRHIHVRG